MMLKNDFKKNVNTKFVMCDSLWGDTEKLLRSRLLEEEIIKPVGNISKCVKKKHLVMLYDNFF